MYNDNEAIDFFDGHPNPGNIDLFQIHIGNDVLTIFVSEDYLDLILIRNNISGGLLE